jgi:glycine/D-amino acid oxidase-like deaminating enzyme
MSRREPAMHQIPAEVDLLVLGAGAGGMTAALSAAILGLDVVLIEKAATVGGTTARSAGSVWVPNSGHDKTGDTRAQALRYLQGTVGNRLRSEMADAFLDNAPRMVDFLEAHSDVRFRAMRTIPTMRPALPARPRRAACWSRCRSMRACWDATSPPSVRRCPSSPSSAA